MAAMDVDTPEIREDLYSRQLYAYGAEAMKNMATSSVLFIGLKGLGVEIAKNVVLSGVKSCTFFDNGLTEVTDLASQYFLEQSDIGKARAAVATPRLQELNPLVRCQCYEGELTDDFLSEFTVIVCTDASLELELRVNDLTHSKGIRYISAKTAGLFGFLFCDFGESFDVFDDNGEACLSQMINGIDEEGTVSVIDEKRHGLETGDFVTFSEIKGMTELNDCEPIEVKVSHPYTFSIGDTSAFGKYTSGGLFHQVKRTKTFKFKSLRDQLKKPDCLVSDWGKFDRPLQLHVGFQALDSFSKQNNRLPRPCNEEDATKFISICKEINSKMEDKADFDEDLMSKLASQATGDIGPMQSVIGGFAAQEVMKATSGKFTPLQQYYYFDSLECLPPKAKLTEVDCAPIGSRYDGQIAVFGKANHTLIKNLKTFLVGSGAIGCEILKNWALMGVACDGSGEIVVTDMDTIEKSNLNRQFLFRSWDVTHPKSEVSSKAVKRINPGMNIIPYQDRVGEETENVFDDTFFDSRDIITNALDNVDARRYVDRRCVYYCKPLLESGTLGTKGNTQVILPHLTESYSSSQDPPEKSIPMCTLKNFPSAIEHTIQWAREAFEGYFTQEPGNVNQYIEQDNFLEHLDKQPSLHQQETLESVLRLVASEKPSNFDDCVSWARFQFQDMFHNKLAQLLHNFPKDMVTSSGTDFWSPPKRCPTALHFDADNSLHIEFIVAAANLRASNFNIAECRDIDAIKSIVSKVVVPEFKPKENVKIQVTENETVEPETTDSSVIANLQKSLPERSSITKLNPADFEKDDDSNFHIDFITACSNLRATAYGIVNATRLKTKGIAGKIIPAIATTTSLIAGLSCLEFYKVAFKNDDIEAYKNSFVNLALPFTAFSEPVVAPKAKYNDTEFTLWDRIDVQGSMTLGDLTAKIEKEHKVSVMIISCGVSMLYACFMPNDKRKTRLASSIEDVIEVATKKKLPDYVKSTTLEILVSNDEDEDVDFPFVRYHLPK